MYHYVRDLKHSRYPGIKGMDLALFKKQLDFFESNFTPITIEDVISAYDDGKTLPDDAVLLTFDDGYIDHFTYVFPILQERGIQGSFFIPGKTFCDNVLLDVNKIHFILASAPIKDIFDELLKHIDELISNRECALPPKEELIQTYSVDNRFDDKQTMFVKKMLQTVLPEDIRKRVSSELFAKFVGVSEENFARELYMNIDQIKCMKRNGMYIGLHGYDHYWLGNLPRDKMERDIEQSLDALSVVIDTDRFIMNYPYGNYNENVLAYLRKLGCKLGMITEVIRDADTNVDDRLLLPRYDCNDFPPKSENYKERK